MPTNERFIDLGSPRRVWAIPAIHGDRERLVALHDHLASKFNVGDRLVYLGNYLGVGGIENDVVIEELLAFRSAILAIPGVEPAHIVHLRGPMEEAWQRLLRLQFAPIPGQALERWVEAGIEPYLRLYGLSVDDARAMARADSVTITRWTNQLRVAQRFAAGHEPLMCSMKRAAVTSAVEVGSSRLLFVPAGFNPARALEDQGDDLWFREEAFTFPTRVGARYSRIIRGFDASRGGVDVYGVNVTLDGGCGGGGPLLCGCFEGNGVLAEIVTVGGASPVDSFAASPTCQTPQFVSQNPSMQSAWWPVHPAARV